MADFVDDYIKQNSHLLQAEPAQPSGDFVDQYIQENAHLLKQAPVESQSGLEAGLRTAAANVAPTAGALAGGWAGTQLGAGIGSFAGPVGTVVGGLIGGAIGGFGGGELAAKGQEKVAETIAPEQYQQFQQKLAEGQQQHPYITTAAALAPMAITHKFTPFKIPSVIKGGSELLKDLSGKPLQEAQKLLSDPKNVQKLHEVMNMAVGAGFQGGGEAYQQIQQGNFEPLKLAIATIGGASFTEARAWTPRILGGEVSRPNVAGETKGQSVTLDETNSGAKEPITPVSVQEQVSTIEPTPVQKPPITTPVEPYPEIRAKVDAEMQAAMERGVPPKKAEKDAQAMYDYLVRTEPAKPETTLPPPAEDTPPVTQQTAEQTGQKEMTPAVEADLQPTPETAMQEQKEFKEKQVFIDAPNMSIDRTQAQKQSDGSWKLMFRGTRNEIFPGEKFNSAQEAKSYFNAEKIKSQGTPATRPEPQSPAPEKANIPPPEKGIAGTETVKQIPIKNAGKISETKIGKTKQGSATNTTKLDLEVKAYHGSPFEIANIKTDPQKSRLGVYFSSHNGLEGSATTGAGRYGNVSEAKLKFKKLLDLSKYRTSDSDMNGGGPYISEGFLNDLPIPKDVAKKALRDYLVDVEKSSNPEETMMEGDIQHSSFLEYLQDKYNLRKMLENKGYDGIAFYDADDGITHVAFKPEQVTFGKKLSPQWNDEDIKDMASQATKAIKERAKKSTIPELKEQIKPATEEQAAQAVPEVATKTEEGKLHSGDMRREVKKKYTIRELKEQIKPATEDQISGLKARGYTDAQIKDINTTKADEILKSGPGGSIGKDIGAQTHFEDIIQMKEQVMAKAKPKPKTVSEKAKAISDRIQNFSLKEYYQSEKERVKKATGSSLKAAIAGAKGIKDYLVELQKGMPGATDREMAVRNYTGEKQEMQKAILDIADTYASDISSDARRKAISAWLVTKGDPKELDKGFKEAPQAYKKKYEDAKTLTPEELSTAKDLEAFMLSTGERLKEEGQIDRLVKAYLHRMPIKKDLSQGDVQRAASAIRSLINDDVRNLSEKRRFSKEWEAEKYLEERGIKMEQDFLPRFIDYALEISRAEADKNLVHKWEGATESDGRPTLLSNDEYKAYAQKYESLKASNPDKEKYYTGDYEPRNYSPLKTRTVKGKYPDPNTGELKDLWQTEERWVHKDAVKQVDAIFKPSEMPEWSKTVLKVSSKVKQSMLGYTFFHPMQLIIHALEHRVFFDPKKVFKGENPFSKLVEINFSNDEQKKISRAGAMFSFDDQLRQKMEGYSGAGGLFKDWPLLGPVAAKLDKITFGEILPRLKMTMALDAVKRNRDVFKEKLASGEMTEEQLYARTADEANAAFGGLNYAVLSRSQTAQDWSRMLFLAPDFLEARGSFVGQALTQTGQEQMKALIYGAGVLYTLARVLNMAISGRPHNEPENAFSVVVDGKAYSLRTLQGDIVHLITNGGQFFKSRLNPLVATTLIEGVTGRDYFGRKRDTLEKMQDMLTSWVPISARGFIPDQRKAMNMWEIMGNSFGFTAKKFDNVKSVYTLAQDWKKAAKVPERGEFIYNPNTDPYRDIKLALSQRDDVAAVKGIIEAIKEHGMTPMKLTEHFAKYANSKFTGSVMNEMKFIKTLTAEQKEAYQEAVKEKHDIFKQFIKARNLYLSEKNKPIKIDSTGNIEMSNIGDE